MMSERPPVQVDADAEFYRKALAFNNLTLSYIARGAPLEQLLDRIASGFSGSYPQRALAIFLFDPQARRLQVGAAPRVAPAFLAELTALAVDDPDDWIIENSNVSDKIPAMVDYLYKRLQRRGYTERDVARMVNQERNVFAALLVALGHGDALISGLTRTYAQTAREIGRVLDPKPGGISFGIHMMIGKNHTTFLADTTINERPTSEQLAHIARETAAVARRMGHEPRVAFLSYSTFGNPSGQWLGNIRDAVALLDADDSVNFEYEGEMAPDAALNPKVMALYPFSRLSGPANVLILPGLQSANLSAKLLRELGGETTIGPLMIGSEKPVQIAPMTAIAPDVLTLAVLASALAYVTLVLLR